MALFLVLLIITYILNPFILRIFVGKTLFLLFELDVAVSYIKLKLMHNLLKLTSIYHLNRQPNLLHVFQIFEEKGLPIYPSDRITPAKTFDRNFIVSSKSM